MKRALAVLLVALPLGIAGLAKSASAAEFNYHPGRDATPVRVAVHHQFRRVWVPTKVRVKYIHGHAHREVIPGHWETVRV